MSEKEMKTQITTGREPLNINPKIIEWALERVGDKRAEDLYLQFKGLDEWLEGKKKPTFRQMQEFAKKVSLPIGYFFLKEPPEERFDIPIFKTGYRGYVKPSIELIDTVETITFRQDWMRDYVRESIDDEPLKFIGSVKIGDDPIDVASSIKKTLNIPQGWPEEERNWSEAFERLLDMVENAGIMVSVNGVVGNNTKRKLKPEEFRGFVLTDDYAPWIFVNGADSKAAQMFTVAHELAHLWIGKSAVFDLNELLPSHDEGEKFCNRIAAEFLVPERRLRGIWSRIKRRENKYQEAAKIFKVSELVAARRMLDLELINRDEFYSFIRSYKERIKPPKEQGGNFYYLTDKRLGRKFAEAVVSQTLSGKITYRYAYELTGLHGETFDKYAKHLGFKPYGTV